VADIKLFRIQPQTKAVSEIPGESVALEKSLQMLIEEHLDALLGVRFLATEFATGKSHAGRIDTLGIDENGCPVIIEYKRTLNENVINQGLFYLDWLLDHRADFKLLVMDRLGVEVAGSIDWSSPRLLCIAGDFTRYDEHAVQQINRTIELIRYRRFGPDLLLLELVNASVGSPLDIDEGNGPTGGKKAVKEYKTARAYLADADPVVRDVFEALKAFLLALGDDVQFKETKLYYAFKRLKNFASVEVHTKCLRVYVKVSPDSVTLEPGFTRDVREIGHWGTGDLEITLAVPPDLERAKALLLKSYEAS
jgi:predicted transport protein